MQEPTRHTSTPDAGAGGVASTHLSQPPPQEQQQDAAPSIVDILLPDTLISILKLLADSPSSIVAFGLTCSTAHALVVTHSTTTLWTDLCKSVVSSHQQQGHNNNNGACSSSAAAKTDPVWSPAAWGLRSHLELYIALLQPYCPLLRQRTWHTTKMADGQLLLVEARPPCLVVSSVFYKNLQGPAFSHPVFVVRVPPGDAAGANTNKAKARVYCSLCEHNSKAGAAMRLVHLDAHRRQVSAVSNYQPARLQFLTQQSSSSTPPSGATPAPAAADTSSAAPTATAASSSAAGADVAAVDGPPADASSSHSLSSIADGGVADHQAVSTAVTGFSLSCSACCGTLFCEGIARLHKAKPHSSWGSSIDADSTQPEQQQQQEEAADAAADAGTGATAAQAAGNSSSSAASLSSAITPGTVAAVLPLPEIAEPEPNMWALRNLVEDLNHDQAWRSSAVYRPFDSSSAWLHPARAAAPATAHAGSSIMPAHGVLGGSATAEGLMGLWRGTYGGHGVELVQLQLLRCPPGYDMWQQHQVAHQQQPSLTSFQQCPGGVLLQSVLQRPAPVPPLPRGAHGVLAAQQDAGGGGAAVVSDAVAPGTATTEGQAGSSQQQQSQEQQQRRRQLLLVATKVTGDRNVPAGQVTFAVDVGASSSRSSSAAGVRQPLRLPPGTQSDVKLGQPGTRELVVKERFPGLAQIAEFHFRHPRVIPVELLVCEGPATRGGTAGAGGVSGSVSECDCLGLLWHEPMASFSLLRRVTELV